MINQQACIWSHLLVAKGSGKAMQEERAEEK